MVLEFTSRNIFGAADDYSQGLGKTRKGQIQIIVASDGTEDAASIQEGINMLPDDGGVVYVKEGTYIILEAINIQKPNVMIEGAGRATEIKLGNSVNDNIIKVGTSTDITTAAYFSMRNIRINGNKANQASTKEGLLLYSDQAFISNVWIHDVKGDGVQIKASYINFVNNHIVDCDGAAMDGIAAVNSIISGNIMDGNSYGVTLNSYDAGTTPIYSNYNIISNNIIFGSTNDGIQISAAGVLGQAVRNVIVGNQIYSNGAYGIDLVHNLVDATYIHGNQVINNTTGQINDNGLNTTASDNVVV